LLTISQDHGRRSGGTGGQVPPEFGAGGLSLPRFCQVAKFYAPDYLHYNVGKCVFRLYSRTFIVSLAMRPLRIPVRSTPMARITVKYRGPRLYGPQYSVRLLLLLLLLLRVVDLNGGEQPATNGWSPIDRRPINGTRQLGEVSLIRSGRPARQKDGRRRVRRACCGTMQPGRPGSTPSIGNRRPAAVNAPNRVST